MNPGEVYKLDYPFQPPQRGASYRPAIVLQTDGTQVLLIKVTHSTPSDAYPYREKIVYYEEAGLDDRSYYQYDWYTVEDIADLRKKRKVGEMNPIDFAKLVDLFNRYHSQ